MRALAALGCLGVVAGQHQSDRDAVAALDSLLDLSDAVDTPERSVGHTRTTDNKRCTMSSSQLAEGALYCAGGGSKLHIFIFNL